MPAPHEFYRIIRFTELPDNFVAKLDKKQNVLVVDRNRFDLLPDWQQSQVLNTDSDLVWGRAEHRPIAALATKLVGFIAALT